MKVRAARLGSHMADARALEEILCRREGHILARLRPLQVELSKTRVTLATS